MVTLRPALSTDAAYLSDLEREAMAGHAQALWGRFVTAEISGFDLGNTRIAEIADMPVGCLTVERAEDHLRLRKLYLGAAHQGRGIGRGLLAVARREAEGVGLRLRLSVLRPNVRALAFYLREGLEVEETTAERIFLVCPHSARAAA
jgi:GNAT superfamily N-acetyltransferase